MYCKVKFIKEIDQLDTTKGKTLNIYFYFKMNIFQINNNNNNKWFLLRPKKKTKKKQHKIVLIFLIFNISSKYLIFL
jgi:hypothetical protein